MGVETGSGEGTRLFYLTLPTIPWVGPHTWGGYFRSDVGTLSGRVATCRPERVLPTPRAETDEVWSRAQIWEKERKYLVFYINGKKSYVHIQIFFFLLQMFK